MALTHPKSFTQEQLVRRIHSWRLRNEKIVFTNGCFDILHPGHCAYLAEAKALGTKLIIGLNTDASVRAQNKGKERPINNQDIRSYMLAALHCVDAICLFDSDTPLNLITLLKPDILVKGADYDPNITDPSHKQYIVGSTEVKKYGGAVEVIEFLEGYSTTSFIEKIKNIG
jgi:rfaE bifunctional protein nucleotidyltransferase chain/domain